MIALSALFALIAVVAYLCTPRMRTSRRLLIAALIFAIPTAAVLTVVVYVGDPPPQCTGAYDPQTGETGPPENCDPPP